MIDKNVADIIRAAGHDPDQVAVILNGLASYQALPGEENEWSGWEFPYEDIVIASPELHPYLTPILLGIAQNPDTQGKWRVLSLVMDSTEPYMLNQCEVGGADLIARVQAAYLAGYSVYLQCLEDPDPETRKMAVCAIAECWIPEASSALRNRLSRETDAVVRKYIRYRLDREEWISSDYYFDSHNDDMGQSGSGPEPNDEIPF
jgi:hypothetical protein